MIDTRSELAVVTGGAGFIGSHLADLILRTGRRVRIVDNLSSGRRGNIPHGAEFLEGDVRTLADPACAGAGVVYHLAAIPSVEYSIEHPIEAHRANVETTLAVLDAAARARVRRIVFASSSAVYGNSPGLPRRESQDPCPQSPYAVGKLSSELYARSWAMRGCGEAVSLRFFNVYGPRQDPSSPYAAVIPRFIECLESGRPLEIHGDGHQTRDFVYVGDVARALLVAGSIKRPAGGCYNIASGQPTTLMALVEALSRVAGSDVRRRHVAARVGDVRHSWADVSLARRELDVSADTSLDDGLRHTLHWFAREAPTRAAARE